jgi:hypothetical protein
MPHHSGLWKFDSDRYERKTKALAPGPVVMEDFDDGWPGYEEHGMIYNSASVLQADAPATIGAVCPQIWATPSFEPSASKRRHTRVKTNLPCKGVWLHLR